VNNLSNEDEVVDEIVRLIEEAYNPKETREVINEKFPDYASKEKIQEITPKVLSKFDDKKRKHLKKTEYMMYVSIYKPDLNLIEGARINKK
jgi:hypothetical protein